MKTLERTASSSEEEASCSSDEEPPSQEKLQTIARNSDSDSEEYESEPSEAESEESESEPSEEESEEFEYEPSEEESEESESEPSEEESEEFEYEPSEEESEESGNNLVSKSVVPVAGSSSKKSDSKGNKTADNVSQKEKGKKKLKSYDLKSKGPQLASSSRISLKAKGDSGISKKRCFPRVWSLEDEITLLNSIHEFQLKEGREVGPSSIELFCDLLKGRLSFTKRPRGKKVSRKIRGLKKKYFRTVKSFTIEHDLKMKEIADRVWKRKSSKRKFPLLKAQLQKLDLHDFQKKFKFEERAVALEKKLKMQRINDMKVALKRLALEKKILKFNLELYQSSDG